jgi:uncharacterized protein (TIGR00369 family)
MRPANLTYGLADPKDVAGMTGKEFLQALSDGTLPAPPIMQPLTMWLIEVGDGFAVFEGEAGPHLLNPQGTVHGGWALTLIDSATTCAALSLLPAGAGVTTIETKGNFSRPIAKDAGYVRAEGRVVTRGRRIISAEARVLDAASRILAHGTATIMVLGGESSNGHPPQGANSPDKT